MSTQTQTPDLQSANPKHSLLTRVIALCERMTELEESPTLKDKLLAQLVWLEINNLFINELERLSSLE